MSGADDSAAVPGSVAVTQTCRRSCSRRLRTTKTALGQPVDDASDRRLAELDLRGDGASGGLAVPCDLLQHDELRRGQTRSRCKLLLAQSCGAKQPPDGAQRGICAGLDHTLRLAAQSDFDNRILLRSSKDYGLDQPWRRREFKERPFFQQRLLSLIPRFVPKGRQNIVPSAKEIMGDFLDE